MASTDIIEALDLMGIQWTSNGYNIWTAFPYWGAAEQLIEMGFRFAHKRNAWYARA